MPRARRRRSTIATRDRKKAASASASAGPATASATRPGTPPTPSGLTTPGEYPTSVPGRSADATQATAAAPAASQASDAHGERKAERRGEHQPPDGVAHVARDDQRSDDREREHEDDEDDDVQPVAGAAANRRRRIEHARDREAAVEGDERRPGAEQRDGEPAAHRSPRLTLDARDRDPVAHGDVVHDDRARAVGRTPRGRARPRGTVTSRRPVGGRNSHTLAAERWLSDAAGPHASTAAR